MKKLAAVSAFLLAAWALVGKDPGTPVTVHEWGTFTSVALDNGDPARWAPWSGPPDLPCFVYQARDEPKAALTGLVRMETPVLYFYAQQPTKLSVSVDFPQGLITEWYPKSNTRGVNIGPSVVKNQLVPTTPKGGSMRWENVEVSPGAQFTFPQSSGASHYFAARATDAAPLQIGNEKEKMIFYRGVGDFMVPLRARYPGDGKLEIRNASQEPIPLVIAFENQGDKLGYTILHDLKDEVSIMPPAMTGDISALHKALAKELVAAGLYEKEAAAMIETWRDSWFEEGTRVFYITPRALVDTILPLKVSPAPTATARVFVGRVEVLSPWTEQTIRTAAERNNMRKLLRFGRFLEPFQKQLNLKTGAVEAARRKIITAFNNGSRCVQ
ncbi:MAG: hypothetical protein ABI811_09340 [Acidobacteriota bacterium]